MELFKKNILLFFLLIVLLFLLILSLFFSLFFPSPKIIEVFPQNNSLNIPINSSLVFKFEKDIKRQLVEISISPFIELTETVQKNILALQPKPSFNFATNYQIVIKNRANNKEIFALNFTTISPQGSPETAKEAQKITQENYPLSPYSPPHNASFYFLYEGEKRLKVFLKKDKETAKKEFEDWVKSLGVNLSTHQITYVSPP